MLAIDFELLYIDQHKIILSNTLSMIGQKALSPHLVCKITVATEVVSKNEAGVLMLMISTIKFYVLILTRQQ